VYSDARADVVAAGQLVSQLSKAGPGRAAHSWAGIPPRRPWGQRGEIPPLTPTCSARALWWSATPGRRTVRPTWFSRPHHAVMPLAETLRTSWSRNRSRGSGLPHGDGSTFDVGSLSAPTTSPHCPLRFATGGGAAVCLLSG